MITHQFHPPPPPPPPQNWLMFSVKPFHPLPPLPHLDRNIAEAPTLSIFLTATHNTHPFAQAHPPPQEAV